MFGSFPFIHLQFSNDLFYRNTYKYSSDTRFLKGVPRMSNNMFVLRSLNKTRRNISMKRLNVPELSVSELVPIISEKSTHKYLRPTSLFLKVFSSRKLIRFPENKLEEEKNHDCQLKSAQLSWSWLSSFVQGVLLGNRPSYFKRSHRNISQYLRHTCRVWLATYATAVFWGSLLGMFMMLSPRIRRLLFSAGMAEHTHPAGQAATGK